MRGEMEILLSLPMALSSLYPPAGSLGSGTHFPSCYLAKGFHAWPRPSHGALVRHLYYWAVLRAPGLSERSALCTQDKSKGFPLCSYSELREMVRTMQEVR